MCVSHSLAQELAHLAIRIVLWRDMCVAKSPAQDMTHMPIRILLSNSGRTRGDS
jgi:hypothetical protein